MELQDENETAQGKAEDVEMDVDPFMDSIDLPEQPWDVGRSVDATLERKGNHEPM